MDISTRGQSRFIIQELVDDKPYMEGKVFFFDDETEEIPTDTRAVAEQGLEYLNEYLGAAYVDIEPEDDALIYYKNISFLISSADGFELGEKQSFLEMTSTTKRIEKSVQALGKMLERMQLSAEISRIIGGNGRLSNALKERLERR
jgi:Lon protease-like protein